MTGITHFIDVSEHQGAADSIRWDELPCPAIVKATEGTTYLDPRWSTWAPAAQAAGKLFGAYHFLTSTSPPETQAASFAAALAAAGAAPRVAVLDWETDSTGTLPSDDYARRWVERFRALRPDLEIWLYGNAWVNHYAREWSCPFWCAWYPGAGAHDLTRAAVLARGAIAWQWTSSGSVAGADDPTLDLNEALDDALVRRLAGILDPATGDDNPMDFPTDHIAHALGLKPALDPTLLGVELQERHPDGTTTPKWYAVGDALANTHEEIVRARADIAALAALIVRAEGAAQTAAAAASLAATAAQEARDALRDARPGESTAGALTALQRAARAILDGKP